MHPCFLLFIRYIATNAQVNTSIRAFLAINPLPYSVDVPLKIYPASKKIIKNPKNPFFLKK